MSQVSTDRLQSLPEAENETEAEIESALVTDILRLQLHSLNKTLMDAQSQITGKKIAYSVDNANPGQSGIVPSLSQVKAHVLHEQLSIPVAADCFQLSTVESSLHVDSVEKLAHEPAIINANEYLDRTNADLLETKFNVENMSLDQAEPSNNISNIIIPKTILSSCSIGTLSFARTKERILQEAAILGILNSYLALTQEKASLNRIGSVFYKLANQKSDINISVLASMFVRSYSNFLYIKESFFKIF